MDKSESVPAITRSLFKRENDRRAGYVIPASASLGTSVTSRLHMMQPTNQRPCNVADALSLFFLSLTPARLVRCCGRQSAAAISGVSLPGQLGAVVYTGDDYYQ